MRILASLILLSALSSPAAGHGWLDEPWFPGDPFATSCYGGGGWGQPYYGVYPQVDYYWDYGIQTRVRYYRRW